MIGGFAFLDASSLMAEVNEDIWDLKYLLSDLSSSICWAYPFEVPRSRSRLAAVSR